MRGWVATVGIALALAGGTPETGEGGVVTAEGRPANDPAAGSGPPPGAIQVGEGGVYMVPGSLDERGCRQYSAWSAEAATPAVVYWRRTDGSFSMDPADADCPGEAR